MAVGFIGLGVMGRPIAARLLAAGNDLVVHTRTRAHADATLEIGARWADAASDVVAECEIVLSCLLDSAVVEAVYLGDGGLLATAPAGRLLIEHGTFSPALAGQIAALAQAQGTTFLDAPVSGGPDGASGGALVTMVGGDAEGVERARPLFDAYSKLVVHVGGSGAGLSLKLVNQHLVAAHVVATAEAALLAQRLELDLAAAGPVLGSGLAASAILDRCLPLMSRRSYDGTGMPIEGLREALKLIAGTFGDAGDHPPLLPVVTHVFERAVDAGRGAQDLAAIAEVIREPATAAERL
jgi:3-hydroxyisobutyrate dehydrogenase-like beta-hydroxyacid dehydrogenase